MISESFNLHRAQLFWESLDKGTESINPFATVIVFFFVDFCFCPTIIVPYPANTS